MITLLVATLLIGTAETPIARPAAVRHEIHSTLTVATVERNAIELRIRIFADDFSASVAAFAGHAAPSDSSVRADEGDRYVQQRVVVTDAAGNTLPLRSCGIERVRDVYLVCYRAEGSGARAPVRLSSLLLTELHTDQVNVVRFESGGSRRTTLLTKSSPAAPIPVR